MSTTRVAVKDKKEWRKKSVVQWHRWMLYVLIVVVLLVQWSLTYMYLPHNDGSNRRTTSSEVNATVEEEYGDKERIVRLLRQANISVSDSVVESLPSWSDVTRLYGEKAVIRGLESCDAFRRSVPPSSQAYIAPAGLYNTGTNLLAKLLHTNCQLTMPNATARSGDNSTETAMGGVRWQVPWGKHSPPSWRLKNEATHDRKIGPAIVQQHVLPVVLIKDPYTWINSMCRHPYEIRWFTPDTNPCPSLLPDKKKNRGFTIFTETIFRGIGNKKTDLRGRPTTTTPSSTNGRRRNDEVPNSKQSHDDDDNLIRRRLWTIPLGLPGENETVQDDDLSSTNERDGHVGPGKKKRYVFTNLVDLWNLWYGDYHDMDNNNDNATKEEVESSFPRLMIRFEDLLFRPHDILFSICTCAGGRSIHPDGTKLVGTSAKEEFFQGSNDLLSALIRYGNETLRIDRMTPSDLTHARTRLRYDMMTYYGYTFPSQPPITIPDTKKN